MKFILISGLSGAGKSKAASFLEDMGYYVVDNMPAALIPKFAELCMASPGRYDKVVLVTDIRGGQTFDGLFDALDKLHDMGCDYKILFVEASVEAIIKRYKETRRNHPLSKTGRSLEEAVQLERSALEPVRQRAEYIVDTSALPTAKLRGEMLRLFGEGDGKPAMSVSVISFGFKNNYFIFTFFQKRSRNIQLFLRAYIPESAEIESVNKRNTLSEAIGIQKCISDFTYFKFKFIKCRYTVIVTTVIVYSAKLIFIK